MPTSREVVLKSISRAIKKGDTILLSGYEPLPPQTADEMLADAAINEVLRAVKEGRRSAFSGVSDDDAAPPGK